MLDRGDINLTFKRYLEAPVRLTLEADYVTRIEGEGADAEMMRSYLAAWGDREAYAVSHVGFGLNRKARYEALAMYDRRDTNGTELRAVAGNFLFSTGANEFAGRYTAGHFDIPVMRTTIAVDGTEVVARRRAAGRVRLTPAPAELPGLRTSALPGGLEQEPGAPLGLVDPDLEQAGGGHIAVLVAQPVRLAHAHGQLLVVVAQLGQHVLRA